MNSLSNNNNNRRRTTEEEEQDEVVEIDEEEKRTYDVWIKGNLKTSSEKLYLILRYISSPGIEKSSDISCEAGVSFPTSNITFFVS